MADNATKRVPIFRRAPAAVPLFDTGDEASDVYSDEAGLRSRFDWRLTGHSDRQMTCHSTRVSRAESRSSIFTAPGFCARRAKNDRLPRQRYLQSTTPGSSPYCAMIGCVRFSKELSAFYSQILFLIGTPLATACPLWHLSEHNCTKCLIQLFSNE